MFVKVNILLCSPPTQPFPDVYLKYLLENVSYIIGTDFYIDGSKIFSEWIWTYYIYFNKYNEITDNINKKINELKIDGNLLYGNCY